MNKLLLFVLLCSFLLNGCYGMGIATFGPETKTYDQEIGISKLQLQEKYGKPDKVKYISEIEELLIYNDGLGWSGIMPYITFFFPIPIPLAIPTHTKWREYHVNNNNVQSETIKSTNISNCFIGYGVENEGTSSYHWMSVCNDGKK